MFILDFVKINEEYLQIGIHITSEKHIAELLLAMSSYVSIYECNFILIFPLGN